MYILKDGGLIPYELAIDTEQVAGIKRNKIIPAKSTKKEERDAPIKNPQVAKDHAPPFIDTKFTKDRFHQLFFEDNIVICLPKKDTEYWWKKTQQYMNIFLQDHNEEEP